MLLKLRNRAPGSDYLLFAAFGRPTEKILTHSPSLAGTPVLSQGIARAALWVGRGAVAVARSRGIRWCPGAADRC